MNTADSASLRLQSNIRKETGTRPACRMLKHYSREELLSQRETREQNCHVKETDGLETIQLATVLKVPGPKIY